MAENEKQAEATESPDATPPARPRQRTAEAQQGPDKYEVSDLIARSSGFLGQPSFVVAGALHGKTEDMTLDDARAAVKAYLSTPEKKEA
jgi:hypothetical protein